MSQDEKETEMFRSKLQKVVVTAVAMGSLAVASPALAQDAVTDHNQAWFDGTAALRAEAPVGETGHVAPAATAAVGGVLLVGGVAFGLARYGRRREHLAEARRLAFAARTALAEWDESSPARAWPLDAPATSSGPVDLSKWNPERGSWMSRRPRFPRPTAGAGVELPAPPGDAEPASA